MLMPHPATLRKLVEEYEALVAHRTETGAVKPDQRTQDLEYTLCVSTGTRDVRSALDRARRHLAASREPGPVVRMPLRPTATAVTDIAEVRDTGEAVA
ncbi:hypothetical protein QFZ75_007354 [Streptomyces sp. V3I8]|jgi:hypothetical protein|uniref:DUF5133 domain-containing protein n=1 Tax=Streptomyces sp. V3I8 TaxID=3042279 RepID=UPI002781C2DA|nr:DUF5133 domain-containing protein [Streptomyces sp. V3I8]MDQ1040938.1 hypothetical protein [Streptomyces sp. V3I8]